jgi:benzoyl-CoA reductase subunit D
MITAGLDCGVQTTKAVILRDGQVIARHASPTGYDQRAAVDRCLAAALAEGGLERGALARIAATGSGRKPAGADLEITDLTADALGAVYADPSARTVIDVGAEESRAMRCAPDGRLLDFALNEKCAAGTGAFLESMARVLDLSVAGMDELAALSAAPSSINAQCAVFTESEIVSLLHANVPTADIAAGVFLSIAGRVASLARRVGIEPDLLLIGGVARSRSFVAALRASLGVSVVVPARPEFAGATGAALAAARLSQG